MSSQAEITDEPDAFDREALALGVEIRTLRRQEGLTLRALAQAVGVSESFLSQVERGHASPSITSLRRIAAALGVPVASLFLRPNSGTSEGDRFGEQLVVRRAERKVLHVPPSKVAYELLTPNLNRAVEFIWIEYAPGAITHPEPMSHQGEENALCIQGAVVVTIDGEEFEIESGDSISFDSGRPHQVENRGSETAVLISAISPPSF